MATLCVLHWNNFGAWAPFNFISARAKESHGFFTFPENDKYAIRELARKASQTEDERSEEDVVIPLRIVTK